jgi:hypothetical protein
MVVVSIPTMQLQNELIAVHEALIFFATMSAGAAKQLLIPSTDGRNIVNADERCQLHAKGSLSPNYK